MSVRLAACLASVACLVSLKIILDMSTQRGEYIPKMKPVGKNDVRKKLFTSPEVTATRKKEYVKVLLSGD